MNANNNSIQTISLKDNRFKMRDTILEEYKNDPKITKVFKLNIKRLNRWWYDVQLEKKCK
jgi:hypothetical protein